MKLHLTKSLRAALLACVCMAVSGQVMAEGTALPAYNQWGNYQLNADNTEWDMSTFEWTTTTDNTDREDTGKIYLENKAGTKLNVSADTVKVNTIVGGGSFEKTGAGTLELAKVSGNGLPENATISEGVLKVDNGGKNGFVSGNATVAAGATLQLAGTDTLGYSGTTWGGNYTDLITLTGESTEKKATLQVDSVTTLSTNINLNGHSSITGAGDIRAFDGVITATGTDNTISTTLLTRKDLHVNVTGEADTLTISGTINDADNTDFTSKDFIKGGEGTLILASTATVNSAVNFIVDEGTVEHQGNVDRSYTLRGGELELNNNRVGKDDGTTTGIITLAAEKDGTTSENVIKSGNSAGAVFTDVTGAGNLTLKNSVNVYADMDYTGNLTLQEGTYNIGYSGYGDSPTIANTGNITIASDATVKVDAKSDNSATLIQNGGNIVVNGSLEVSKGTIDNTGSITVSGTNAKLMVNSQATIKSDITVSNGGTLDVGTNPTMTLSTVSVGVDGVLDLSDTLTLTLEGLDLAAGTTIILGENTRIEITDALTIGSGVIFDVSSWCDYDSFNPYELISYTGSGTFDASGITTGFVTIKTSTGDNEKAYLTVADGKVTLVPEPTTATLSLLALAGLCARRRRK